MTEKAALSTDMAVRCREFADAIDQWMSSFHVVRLKCNMNEIDLSGEDACLGAQFAAEFRRDLAKLSALLVVNGRESVVAQIRTDFAGVVQFLRDDVTPYILHGRRVCNFDVQETTMVIPGEEAHFASDNFIPTPLDNLLSILRHIAELVDNTDGANDLVTAHELSLFAGYRDGTAKTVKGFLKRAKLEPRIGGGKGQGNRTQYLYSAFLAVIDSSSAHEMTETKIKSPDNNNGQWPANARELKEFIRKKLQLST